MAAISIYFAKAAVKLELKLVAYGAHVTSVWRDDAAGTLETKIAEICADIVVIVETAHRTGLKEEAAEAERRMEEYRRRAVEAQKAADAERVKNLLRSGELLSQAENLRAVIARDDPTIRPGDVGITERDIAAWRQWAHEQADLIDPVKSRQVMSHLRRREA